MIYREKPADNYSRMPFTSLLTIVFITLKLTGCITWSWWMVTAPLWGSALLWLLVVVGAVTYIAIKESK